MNPFSLLIFARAPVEGQCKTRLIPAYGARGAAGWHRRLTLQTMALAHRSGAHTVELWCAPDAGHPLFQGLRRRRGISTFRQAGRDLGSRMLHALNHAQSRHPGIQLLIGTDCAALTPQHLERAASALAGDFDCALIPAEDGGFVLIGSRRRLPRRIWEGVAWSSGRELAQTCRRLRRNGLSVAVLEPLWDIDHPADLRRARRLQLVPPVR